MSTEESPVGPAATLKHAAELFRQYEAHHQEKLQAPEIATADLVALGEKILRNREAAEMCESALKQIEAMSAAALEVKRASQPPGPTPAGYFQLGWSYGELAGMWKAMDEEQQATWLEGENRREPFLSREDAWAAARAFLTQTPGGSDVPG